MEGAMRKEIRSFLDYTELRSSKIGQRGLFGFIYPRYHSLKIRFLEIFERVDEDSIRLTA